MGMITLAYKTLIFVPTGDLTGTGFLKANNLPSPLDLPLHGDHLLESASHSTDCRRPVYCPISRVTSKMPSGTIHHCFLAFVSMEVESVFNSCQRTSPTIKYSSHRLYINRRAGITQAETTKLLQEWVFKM